MDAETYLRNLAESELRRYRDGGPESMLEATGRVRAVAAAFAGTGVLEPAVADIVLDELTTALMIRSPRDPRARHRARLRHARQSPLSASDSGRASHGLGDACRRAAPAARRRDRRGRLPVRGHQHARAGVPERGRPQPPQGLAAPQERAAARPAVAVAAAPALRLGAAGSTRRPARGGRNRALLRPRLQRRRRRHVVNRPVQPAGEPAPPAAWRRAELDVAGCRQ